jgi:hypothetical protein
MLNNSKECKINNVFTLNPEVILTKVKGIFGNLSELKMKESFPLRSDLKYPNKV